jgi:steroid 5-alpha reductase family enzyme
MPVAGADATRAAGLVRTLHGGWFLMIWWGVGLLADDPSTVLWQAGGPVLLVLCLASRCPRLGGRGVFL